MLIVCPHCLKPNRVPPERAADDPTCGHCHSTLLDAKPVALDDSTFDRVIARTELPIVVDLWASWCGPCMVMAPHYAQAAATLKGRALFTKVDSDASPQTSTRFAVRSIPTLLLLRGGQEVKRQTGAIQAAQIVAWTGL